MKVIGRPIAAMGRGIKNFIKRLVWTPNLFENLGIDYMGPVNGHDIRKLEAILEEAKLNSGATIIHVCTQKGRGYELAEKSPSLYHSVAPFDPRVGISGVTSENGDVYNTHSFSDAFGQRLAWHANDNKDIVAITAAMCEGTGLTKFREIFPERFYDVGIAEEHAVTFAAGLAAAGLKPVVAIYSSFLQRGYDQVIHDVAIQGLPVVFAIDHAGFVSGDGATHQGIFDCGFLLTIPEITVYSVESFNDMGRMLDEAMSSSGPVAIRYPKGGECEYSREAFLEMSGYRVGIFGTNESERICLITYGRLAKQAYEAAVQLSDTYMVAVVVLTRLQPLNVEGMMQVCGGAQYVYFLEEHIKAGGVGERLLAEMAQIGCELPLFEINALTEFPRQGSLNDLYDMYEMSAEMIEEHVRKVLGEASESEN